MKMEKALINIAYEVMEASKEALSFKDLFSKVIALSGRELNDDELKREMSRFYTQLSLDGRFACFSGNTWDLRSRHSFKDTYVNISDYDSDEESSDDDEEEKKLLQEELGEEDYGGKDDLSDDDEEKSESKDDEEF